MFCLLVAAIVMAGVCFCSKAKPSDSHCGKIYGYTETRFGSYSYINKIDILVVVDDSASMEEEQNILATSLFTLVNFLTSPTFHFPYDAVNDIRVGIVTSDMGLQYGDGSASGDIDVGEFCDDKGKDGALQTINVDSIDVESGVIPCDSSTAVCPPEWTCSDLDTDGVGTCTGTSPVNCGSIDSDYVETTYLDPNDKLALQAACMSQVGLDGCGIEQQLIAAAQGLQPEVNSDFIRQDRSLLVVLVVSDEEDCSVKDGTIFDNMEEDGQKTPSEINLTCGNNESKLFEESFFYNSILNVKSGNEGLVVFAAIAGVPPGDVCEGNGLEIANCLDETEMQNVPVTDTDADTPFKVFRPACTRTEGIVEYTAARPGRRFVRLAQQFGELGYVYSICNADWTPAMKDISKIIYQVVGVDHSCFYKPLHWDAEKQQTECSLIIEYFNETTCPDYFELEEGTMPRIEVDNDSLGNDVNIVKCPLAKLEAPLDCEKAYKKYQNSSKFGWFYCQNKASENYQDVCRPDGDGIDEDNDGLTDCEDKDCWECSICSDVPGVDPSQATSRCIDFCKYHVQMTEPVLEKPYGQRIILKCPDIPYYIDEECSEGNTNTCEDGIDNDGDRTWDCNDISDGSLQHHFADPSCCPMTFDDGKCIIQFDKEGTKNGLNELCSTNLSTGSDISELPDACIIHSKILGCEF